MKFRHHHDHHHFTHTAPNTETVRFENAVLGVLRQLLNRLEKIMSALDDQLAAIKASQAETSTKIASVKTDVEALLAKIAAFPPSGLTADQQQALTDILTASNGINASLQAVDDEVPSTAVTDPANDPNVNT